MDKPAILTKNLTRRFGDILAVDRINLEIPAGIVFGFLGPNGSGKTTTIRLLLGLLEPQEGSAEVMGLDTRSHPDEIRTLSGALLEHTGLYERLSAWDNLDFFGRIYHIPGPTRATRVQELLTGMQLWDRRAESVGSWSRGMKQKLAVARAMLHHPQLIFLDEPTAGLDPVAAADLRETLAHLAHQEGVTVFLTTHNLGEAEKLCSRVAVIKEGALLMTGSPDELRMSSGEHNLEIVGRGLTEEVLTMLRKIPEVQDVKAEDRHVTLTLRDETDTSGIVQALVKAGVQIDEIRKGKASLEDVFMTLMEEEK